MQRLCKILHRSMPPITAEPAEQFLGAVSKEDHAERQPQRHRGPLLFGRNPLLQISSNARCVLRNESSVKIDRFGRHKTPPFGRLAPGETSGSESPASAGFIVLPVLKMLGTRNGCQKGRVPTSIFGDEKPVSFVSYRPIGAYSRRTSH